MNKKVVIIFVFILFLGASAFGSGFYFGKSKARTEIIFGVQNSELGQPQGVDFSLFWEAWAILQNKYVERDNLDPKQMLYGAISGMLKSLKDPYTVFLPPQESKIFKEDMSGEFQGVGMEIGMRDGQITVISPLEETPAFIAGIMAGDKIIMVNGSSTQDMTVEEAVRLIRGQKGTAVILTIARKGWQKTKDFEIIRDVIQIPSIKFEIKDNDIAYIKIYHFSETARVEFSKAAIKILNSNAKKIILDIRNNPGGFLEIAQDISSWFLKKGEIVAIEDFGQNKEKNEYKSNGSGPFVNYPVAVLINEGSASASEILAGALRDNRGIKLIGEKSFGKGSVQQLEDLREGSIKVTIARWLTPKGNLISGLGLEPDVKIEITEDNIKSEKDPQLDKAINLLNEL
ncbi:MAG: S41 family peptidase [Candidatus Nealsonbacteria bacterium]|nr:S41 family peptidase [Candidatus Nealsonbacteria bacterium]